MIKIIVAVSNNNVIGKDNKLLWKQSHDLKRFKELTLNKKVIMGRKTYESIGKPLPNRENYILSRSKSDIKGCKILNSIDDVMKIEGEIFIIGGGEIYKKFINLADEILLTKVDCEVEGDTFFNFDENKFQLKSEEVFNKDDKNQFNWKYQNWIKK